MRKRDGLTLKLFIITLTGSDTELLEILLTMCQGTGSTDECGLG